MNRNDTICAISTPAGTGGVAMLRLSGNEAKRLAESLLRLPSGKPIALRDHQAMMARLYDGEQMLDEVVATHFAAPHSYTGEEVTEITCHGSPYIQQRILQLFIENGARLAEAGEFTLRAFLNGRLDLSQAEAVADLIDARSQASHQLAISQLRGNYAYQLEQLRQQLIDLTALLELELDFSDEEVEFANREHLKEVMTTLKERIAQLIQSFNMGNALKNGIPVAIVGRPNAGKSTLLNTLLADDRAIVSPIPGTTRDTIEECIILEGIQFRFIDTAGLHDSDNPIEQIGIDRAIRSAQSAKIILYLIDGQAESSDEIAAFTHLCPMEDKHLIVIRNKCDLGTHGTAEELSISALRGDGIEVLKKRIVSEIREDLPRDNDVVLTNMRHYEALKKVLAALSEAEKSMNDNMTADLIVIDLRDALYHLGTITGKITSEDVLTSIFSRFCIGK